MAVLVTLQLMASLAVANLVHRKDQPPPWLVAPLQGIVGKILCLSDMPLVGEVSETWILCNLLEIRWVPANIPLSTPLCAHVWLHYLKISRAILN